MIFPSENYINNSEYIQFDEYATGTGTSTFVDLGADLIRFYKAEVAADKKVKIKKSGLLDMGIAGEYAVHIVSAYVNMRTWDTSITITIGIEGYPSSFKTYPSTGHSFVQIQTNPVVRDVYHMSPDLIIECNTDGHPVEYKRIQHVTGSMNKVWAPSVADTQTLNSRLWIQSTAPSGYPLKHGDVWVDTSSSNKMKVFVAGVGWQTITI